MTHTSLTQRLRALIPHLEAAHVRWTDVRLHSALKPLRDRPDMLPPGGPAEAVCRELDAPGRVSLPALEALADAIEGLLTRTVRQELEELLRSVKWGAEGHASRNAKVVRAWVLRASTDPVTLNELGAKHGLTRERIRQVIERMTQELVERGAWTPAADRALAWLSQRAPIRTFVAESDAEFQALLGPNFGAASLLRWREALDKGNANLQIDEVSPSVNFSLIAPFDQRQVLRERMTQFRALARRRGAVPVSQLPAEFQAEAPQVLANLSIDPRFGTFEIQGCEWAWFGSADESRLAEEVRGVLSILPPTGDIGWDDLLTAIRRDERFSTMLGDQALPDPVFRHVVSSLMDVEVRGERLRLKGDLVEARKRCLTDRERALFTTMAAAGGTMSRQAIAQAFQRDEGSSIESIAQLLHYWRGVQRLQRGVFRLTGWPEDEAGLEQAAREAGQRAAVSSPRVDAGAEEIEFDYQVRPSVWTVKRMQVPATHQGWFAHCGHRRFRSDQVPGLVMGTGTEASGVVRLRRIDEVFDHLQVKAGDLVRVRVRKNGSVSVERKAA